MVQLHNLPIECINQEAGYTLGETIGEVIYVDSSDSYPNNFQFLRIRVWISVANPLISGFYLQDSDGSLSLIEYSYERVFKHCRNCGRIGHTYNQC